MNFSAADNRHQINVTGDTRKSKIRTAPCMAAKYGAILRWSAAFRPMLPRRFQHRETQPLPSTDTESFVRANRLQRRTGAFYQWHTPLSSVAHFDIYLNGVISKRLLGKNSVIVLYAKKILLLAPHVTELNNYSCPSAKMNWLNCIMAIIPKKSCSLRIEPRCAAICANLVTTDASFIIVGGRNAVSMDTYMINLHCSLAVTQMLHRTWKKTLFSASGTIFDGIGHLASE